MWKIYGGSWVRVSKVVARKVYAIAPEEVIIFPENSIPQSYGFSKMVKNSNKGSFDDIAAFYFDYYMRAFRYGGRYPAFAVPLSWWKENYNKVDSKHDPSKLEGFSV